MLKPNWNDKLKRVAVERYWFLQPHIHPLWTALNMHIRTCIHTHTHSSMHVHKQVHTHACMLKHACTYTLAHMDLRTCTCTHTHVPQLIIVPSDLMPPPHVRALGQRFQQKPSAMSAGVTPGESLFPLRTPHSAASGPVMVRCSSQVSASGYGLFKSNEILMKGKISGRGGQTRSLF